MAIVTVIHIIVCLFLMLTVLLQSGKGGMGAAFGGGGGNTGTVFGGAGAGNFLRKLTVVSAVVFMLSSMTLAYIGSVKNDNQGGLADSSAESKRKAEIEDQSKAEIRKRQEKEALDKENAELDTEEAAGDSTSSDEGATSEKTTPEAVTSEAVAPEAALPPVNKEALPKANDQAPPE